MAQDDNDGSPKPGPPAPYSVGFGKPPVEHRFKKGEPSRNPKGRPPGSRNRLMRDGSELSLADIVQREANRPVTIRENDKTQEISALEAIVRGTMASAAKGDFRSRKLAIQMVEAAKKETAGQREQLSKTAIEFKTAWTQMCERYRDQCPDAALLPNPDDVRIEPDTGGVIWKSPWLDAIGAQYDDWRNNRDRQLKAALRAEIAFYRAKDPEEAEYLVEEWRASMCNFDELNIRLRPEDRETMPADARDVEQLSLQRIRQKLLGSINRYTNRARP